LAEAKLGERDRIEEIFTKINVASDGNELPGAAIGFGKRYNYKAGQELEDNDESGEMNKNVIKCASKTPDLLHKGEEKFDDETIEVSRQNLIGPETNEAEAEPAE
jgi:hypothetical protein